MTHHHPQTTLKSGIMGKERSRRVGVLRAEVEEHVKEPASHGPLCMNASASYLSLQLQASESPLTRSHYPPGMFFLILCCYSIVSGV